jgi:hypothetical protein
MDRKNLIYIAKGIAKKAGKKEYLNYQLEIIGNLIINKTSVLKMPRQTGKSWSSAVVACAYLMAGIDVMVAYPTLNQGYRLLLSRIAEILRACGVKLTRFSQNGITLSNGARVHVVTTNDKATSNEGYTVGCLIIDEAHRCSKEKFADMFPSLKVYMEKDQHTIILCGIRGQRDSIIEIAWRDREFKLIHIMPDEIVNKCPSYQISLDQFKINLSPEEYNEQILCEFTKGISQIFHNLNEPVPEHCLRQQYTDVIGVDVGQKVDATIVTWLRYYPSNTTPHVRIIKTMRLTDRYDVQGEKIINFIRENNLINCPIGIEVNGVGRGLYDIVCKLDDNLIEQPISNVNGFVCTARSKANIIKWLQSIDRDRALHIDDKAVFNSLDGLQEKRTDEGKMKYDHSDYLSSLIVAGAMVGFG